MVKNLPVNVEDVRDVGLIPGLGRSPEEGNGNPLQYACLENPMDGGAQLMGSQSPTQLKRFSSCGLGTCMLQVFGEGESHGVNREFMQVFWKGQNLSSFQSDSLRNIAM